MGTVYLVGKKESCSEADKITFHLISPASVNRNEIAPQGMTHS